MKHKTRGWEIACFLGLLAFINALLELLSVIVYAVGKSHATGRLRHDLVRSLFRQEIAWFKDPKIPMRKLFTCYTDDSQK
ncbi:hypothetical protein Ciccas_014439, partial [Cichlidogyrus casuarinus]